MAERLERNPRPVARLLQLRGRNTSKCSVTTGYRSASGDQKENTPNVTLRTDWPPYPIRHKTRLWKISPKDPIPLVRPSQSFFPCAAVAFGLQSLTAFGRFCLEFVPSLQENIAIEKLIARQSRPRVLSSNQLGITYRFEAA